MRGHLRSLQHSKKVAMIISTHNFPFIVCKTTSSSFSSDQKKQTRPRVPALAIFFTTSAFFYARIKLPIKIIYFLRAQFRISLLGDPLTLQVEIKIQFNVFRVFFYRQPREITLYATTRGSRFLSLSLLKYQKLTLGCTRKFIPPP